MSIRLIGSQEHDSVLSYRSQDALHQESDDDVHLSEPLYGRPDRPSLLLKT